jgi:hypothetical protein
LSPENEKKCNKEQKKTFFIKFKFKFKRRRTQKTNFKLAAFKDKKEKAFNEDETPMGRHNWQFK